MELWGAWRPVWYLAARVRASINHMVQIVKVPSAPPTPEREISTKNERLDSCKSKGAVKMVVRSRR